MHLAVAALLLAASSAGATVMRIGRLARTPAGAHVVGMLAPATLLHITVALKPRDPAALQSYVRAVSSPSSLYYRAYLTPAQFARRFGASSAEVRVVRDDLLAHGLRPGPLSAGGLSLPIVATAARIERGFSVSLRRLRLSGRRTAVAASPAPALDAGAAPGVQAVIGLSSVAAPHPLLVHGRPASAGSATLVRSHASAGSAPAPCPQAQSAASSSGAHTADQIASAYGFTGLYGAGDLGAGTTIAVYELEPVDPNDLAQYQTCYGISASISYVKVDGGAGAGAGSGESALDIEQVLGLAPRASVIVYQGQNSNSGAPGSGPYDTFRAIIDQDRAQVVSVSWGECEQMLGASNAQAESTLFEQAAVQGQTIVSAAGDSGSEDCDGSSATPQTQLAVDDPASQPYVLGVGGTSLSSLGPRPTESVWNDGGGLITGLLQPGAGGGGISSFWEMPAPQRDAASFLNVLGAGITGSQCGAAGGYCREVPDVAMDADPATGYVIYYNGSGSQPAQEAGWQAIGGTSAAAPVWTALMALTDASRGCSSGGPLGYVLPALYRAASSSYAADFNDVRSGNNDFTQTNGGQYAAGPWYDEASGLGSPNGAALAGSLCPDTLRIATPSAQESAAQATVSLRLRATDVHGSSISFRTVSLPPGLSVDQTTGKITGRIRRAGTYHVTAAAMDSQASVAATRFTWSVGDATRVLDQSLTGLGGHKPALVFTVAAGRGAPALQTLDVTMPAELVLTSVRGITLQANGSAARFSDHRTGQTLAIDLRRQLRRVRVTLSFPQIKVNSGRHPNSPAARELTLAVTDANRGMTRIRARP